MDNVSASVSSITGDGDQDRQDLLKNLCRQPCFPGWTSSALRRCRAKFPSLLPFLSVALICCNCGEIIPVHSWGKKKKSNRPPLLIEAFPSSSQKLRLFMGPWKVPHLLLFLGSGYNNLMVLGLTPRWHKIQQIASISEDVSALKRVILWDHFSYKEQLLSLWPCVKGVLREI